MARTTIAFIRSYPFSETPARRGGLQDIRTALEKAAKDDMRPVSHLVQKIVADWLKEK
jgi:hypothetical protein